MNARRHIEEVRADAHVIRRERVLRWLTRISEHHAEAAAHSEHLVLGVSDKRYVHAWLRELAAKVGA